MLLTRAYHEDRGEHRTKVLTPDTAHGTNPATVTMAGYEVVKVGTDAHGNVDLDDLRAKADEDVACLMLTNPSTLGLFETGIEEIARIVHGVGATLYYDGANLNAIMGICRPGRHGLRHRPLQPAQVVHPAARRRRPGRRPDRGVRRGSSRTCRGRRSSGASRPRTGPTPFYDLDYDRPKSIGRLRGFQGNYGVFVRSYAYIRSLGAPGLREVSEIAVLNANYLLARLRAEGVPSTCRPPTTALCMHEFVLSGAPMQRELQIKTLDLAKRLLDHGVHPPTVYFPLIVDEALLIEPTETETKETLDRFAEIVAEILREAREDPEIARSAPYTTPVRRLDEAGAARRPVVRQAMQARSPACGSSSSARARSAAWSARSCTSPGYEVALIARGAHYRAIRERGLTLERPGESVDARDPGRGLAGRARVERRRGRAARDQEPGHGRRARGAARRRARPSTPVVCVQNGVENERIALRLFRERVRRGGDGADRAPRAGHRPGVRDPRASG